MTPPRPTWYTPIRATFCALTHIERGIGRSGTRACEGYEGVARAIASRQLVISKPILDELLGILARKFSRDAEELAHVAVFLSDLALSVKPRRRLQVVKDEPDNRILECALAGRAEPIVTGDHSLLSLGEYRKVRIISPRDYLAGTS